ncbi:hypothetical protein KIPB_006114 [Kipferlia bialata]|uniref:Uncharacterized protein n=1 Tax=Kipferlia bialata TaxID=797122 RepID=A0A9K3CZP4_9EUKA|nr:hypothetical protein KIPB_006114 [Kipferlia bialata]|eukprot:g6114.t1
MSAKDPDPGIEGEREREGEGSLPSVQYPLSLSTLGYPSAPSASSVSGGVHAVGAGDVSMEGEGTEGAMGASMGLPPSIPPIPLMHGMLGRPSMPPVPVDMHQGGMGVQSSAPLSIPLNVSIHPHIGESHAVGTVGATGSVGCVGSAGDAAVVPSGAGGAAPPVGYGVDTLPHVSTTVSPLAPGEAEVETEAEAEMHVYTVPLFPSRSCCGARPLPLVSGPRCRVYPWMGPLTHTPTPTPRAMVMVMVP